MVDFGKSDKMIKLVVKCMYKSNITTGLVIFRSLERNIPTKSVVSF